MASAPASAVRAKAGNAAPAGPGDVPGRHALGGALSGLAGSPDDGAPEVLPGGSALADSAGSGAGHGGVPGSTGTAGEGVRGAASNICADGRISTAEMRRDARDFRRVIRSRKIRKLLSSAVSCIGRVQELLAEGSSSSGENSGVER